MFQVNDKDKSFQKINPLFFEVVDKKNDKETADIFKLKDICSIFPNVVDITFYYSWEHDKMFRYTQHHFDNLLKDLLLFTKNDYKHISLKSLKSNGIVYNDNIVYEIKSKLNDKWDIEFKHDERVKNLTIHKK